MESFVLLPALRAVLVAAKWWFRNVMAVQQVIAHSGFGEHLNGALDAEEKMHALMKLINC